MKQTMENAVHIEGLVYQHDLKKKVSGPKSKNPNTPFINGTLDIATDDALTNIVQVHFSYVTPTTKNGNPNNTYEVLKNIADNVVGNVMANGADKAGKVRIDTSIGVNDFYTNRGGKDELVSAKRNEGGFVHYANNDMNPDEKARNTFECDIVLTNVIDVDPNEEAQTEGHVILRGYVFGYGNTLIPVDFIANNPVAMDYFRNLEATPNTPVFTRVKGRQISQTIVTKVTEESAFGEPSVKEVRKNRKAHVVYWAQTEPYLWDDESTITASELTELKAAREVHLAAVKKNQEEYAANKGNAIPTAPAASASIAAAARAGFNF